ncbi:MAG: anaerobic sulfatase-maturation protein [Prevotella sp.]|uniref:Anaerobic sulfatase-maturation protein n=1 Tax=Hallella faecis TaxID=2841596 RepID=A0ABV1FSU9_9BACT|nr:anaerobic sulfatase-maturation protein [Hallella faecis]MBU0290738.1 anaerobic sulfatase-maturation protein [Hallella faecis]MCI7434439.1 anaerobic sulfatase-maturation protein [Prevotella sp.]
MTASPNSTTPEARLTAAPFAHPMYIMVKPVGSACNLRCDYCYYLEKQHLYANEGRQMLSDELLERFIREYIESQTTPEVLFTWHGGEPLVRPLAFYEKVVRLQQRYARGRRIANSLQTNGTLINDDWARFFHDQGWLIGVSLDGPEAYHDAFRRTRGGGPSFRNVIRGIDILNRHAVEWNALAVANRLNGDHPLSFYRFFKNIGCQYIQVTPVVERLAHHDDGRQLASLVDEGQLAPFSIRPKQWGNFLCTIFDEWVRHDVSMFFFNIFDATLANWVGVAPGLCTMAKHCGHAGVMEHNGDVYSCDHFVFPEYKLGNIHEQSLVEMMYSERQRRFGRAKADSLPTQCRECQWLNACHGECPRNRFIRTANGEPGLNYLCEGYRQYFSHVAPYMDVMKRLLGEKRPPAEIMDMLATGALR